METGILKEMTAVIRAEQQRRASLLQDEALYYANDQWLFNDEPFLNELCLMLLVALRHQIERELVDFAARVVANEGEEISPEQYEVKRSELLSKSNRWNWKKIHGRLQTASCEEYKTTEALRLLANSYKHNPSMDPNKDLLEWLNLETKGNPYDRLTKSYALREGLATFIGLGKDADYCDITELFVDIASEFLVDVQGRTRLGRVKRGSASFKISKAAR